MHPLLDARIDAGVRVFPLDLGSEHLIDGVFTRSGEGHACVGVNTGKWVFRQVFTVVHEYGHALMDADLRGFWRLQNERLITAAERKRLKAKLHRHGTVALARSLGYDFRRFAQPFHRAHEIAIRAYAAGEISLGGAAEIFGLPKEEMRTRFREWGIEQELREEDVLVGGGV